MRRQFLACVLMLFSANSVSSDTLHHTISASPTTCYKRVYQAQHLASVPAQRVKSVSLFFDPSSPEASNQLPLRIRFTFIDNAAAFTAAARCQGNGGWLDCTTGHGTDRFSLQQGPEGGLQLIVGDAGFTVTGPETSVSLPTTPQAPKIFRLNATRDCQ